MRHTEGMRQSVIMTRKLDYAAFCQSAIKTFDSKLRHYDVRHNGVRQSGMRQNTIPPLSIQVLQQQQAHIDPFLSYCRRCR